MRVLFNDSRSCRSSVCGKPITQPYLFVQVAEEKPAENQTQEQADESRGSVAHNFSLEHQIILKQLRPQCAGWSASRIRSRPRSLLDRHLSAGYIFPNVSAFGNTNLGFMT